MNAKQERFCLEYAKSGNGADAYKKAGYKCKTNSIASANVTRLLKNESIQARLKELTEGMRSDAIANAAEVQERLTRILRMEETEDQVITEGLGDGITEARIVRKRPMLKDVIKAGETLAKMQGAYDYSVNVNVNIPVFGGDDQLED